MDDATAIWVTPSGVASYGPRSQVPTLLGAKARGLLWLPSAWVPPFFALSPEIHSQYCAANTARRAALLAGFSEYFASACELAKIEKNCRVMLRSNAVGETLRERGRYASTETRANKVANGLMSLFELLPTETALGSLGVIVQQYITPIAKGHLSNERRVAEEYRDGLIELEDASGAITERKISFRRWRSSRQTDEGALPCRSLGWRANLIRR